MKKLIQNAWDYVVATKFGKLIVSGVFFIAFAILANYYDWATWALAVSCVYPVAITVEGIVYAWIINPWEEHKQYIADKAAAAKATPPATK